MERSRLRNKLLNTKNDTDSKAYNKQRNICVTLIRKENKNFNGKLNTRCITDSKTSKKAKPFFTDKLQTKSKVKLNLK